jgi:hypothetical protein
MAGPEVRHVHRVMVHPDVGRQVRWPVGSAPKQYCLGCWTPAPDSGAGQAVPHGVLVKANPRLLWEDRYLTGPPRGDLGYRGNAIIRIAWPPPRMLC